MKHSKQFLATPAGALAVILVALAVYFMSSVVGILYDQRLASHIEAQTGFSPVTVIEVTETPSGDRVEFVCRTSGDWTFGWATIVDGQVTVDPP